MIFIVRQFIEHLWVKTRKREKLSGLNFFVFVFLLSCKPLYYCAFLVGQWWRRNVKRKKKIEGCFVVSIGNISLGGTGKTPFIHFLVAQNFFKTPALISRGYKGVYIKKSNVFLVSNGSTVYGNVEESGDEAYMTALKYCIPVAVSSDRIQAVTEITKTCPSVDTVLLDDAYQYHSIVKDCEILLLDARWPFENNHHFPAGRLREKDCSRANIIILTHADMLAPIALQALKKDITTKNKCAVFAGKHRIEGLFRENDKNFSFKDSGQVQVLAFAGIGSPQGFKNSLASYNSITIKEFFTYPDHYYYKQEDMKLMINKSLSLGINVLVTTEKDWYKIVQYEHLLRQGGISCYVLQVIFEFLTEPEYHSFRALMTHYKENVRL